MLDSRIRIVPAFVLALAICSNANAQVDLFVDGGNDFYRQQVVQGVKQELTCLKIVAELTDEQADTILENLDELIDEESGRIAEESQNGTNGVVSFSGMSSSKALTDAVLVEAKSLLGPKAAKAFEEDLALRKKFDRNAAQGGLLVGMDGLLQLTDKQHSVIAKLVKSKWNDDWNSLAMFVSHQGGVFAVRKQLKELPQEEIRAVLSEYQWAALDGMLNLDETAVSDQVGFAKLQGQAVAVLKLEELTGLCKLSDAQASKLKEAINTALTECTARKTEAINAMQAGNFDFQGNMDLVMDMSRPIEQMMFGNETWKTAVDEVLNEEQAAKYATRQALREKRAMAAMTAASTSSYAMQVGGLTAKQQAALTKLFAKHLAKTTADPAEQTKRFMAIPDEAYQEILNEEQWEKMSQMITSMRQQFGIGDAAVEGDGAVVGN